jgi:ribosomal protein L29
MTKVVSLKELNDKSVQELKDLLAKTRSDLSKIRFQVAINKDKNVKAILAQRKQVSRILTLLTQRTNDSINAVK